MAVYRFNGQKLSPGAWVNPVSMLLLGFAGNACQVVEVKEKSVLIRHTRRLVTGEVDFYPPHRKLLTSIAFVCDTLEEAEETAEASHRHVAAERVVEAEQRTLAEQRRAEAIAALLSPSPSV